ncbi:MAG: patatin-like phospholipase family protein [Candidatus Paceibacterota bacterium]
MKNICITAQGGGLKSAYSVGVIKGLREKYSLDEVDLIVGSSGAGSTFAYFITKQYDYIEKIWIELVKSGEFIKIRNFFLRGPIMDIDFLVDTVLKKKFPLDINSLKSSKTELYIPLLRYSDCKGIYFTNHESEDPYEIIRAACAVPYFFGKRVKLNN